VNGFAVALDGFVESGRTQIDDTFLGSRRILRLLNKFLVEDMQLKFTSPYHILVAVEPFGYCEHAVFKADYISLAILPILFLLDVLSIQ